MAKHDFSKLTKEQKLELYNVIQEKKKRIKDAKPLYKPNEGQRAFHECEALERWVFSGNGCWAAGTEIRMYDGSIKKVEDIKIGDKLMGPDSKPRTVQKLFNGVEPMYKVVPKHSKPYIVNENHTLSIFQWKTNKENPNKSDKVYKEITVKDFLKLGKETQRTSYQHLADSIDYPEKELELPPYILGLWLGDGTSSEANLTSMDPEPVREWLAYADSLKLRCRRQEKEYNKAITYCLVDDNRPGNAFKQKLRKENLLKNKHIPEQYLINSRENRLELLAGIIDTDGHVTKGSRTSRVEIVQKRKNLIDETELLARSLGFMTSRATKYVKGKEYHRLYIRGNIEEIPIRIKRKQANVSNGQRNHLHETFKLIPHGIDEFFGFTVDKDHLVLLGNYIVQRNSGKTTGLINEVEWAAKGYNPVLDKYTKVPANIVVVLDNPDKIEQKFKVEHRKWFNFPWEDRTRTPKDGRPYISRMLYPNGSTVSFFFHGQEPLRFEGLDGIDYIMSDEPLSRNIYVALFRGLREKNSQPKLLVVGTPIAQPWLRKEVYEPWSRGERPDTECFRVSSEVNRENLREGFLEQFEARLTESEKKTRLQGSFFDADSMPLAGLFDRDTHVIPKFDWPRHYGVVVVIDFHQAKPTNIIMVGSDHDGQLYYIKEFESNRPPKQMASQIRDFMDGYKVIDIVCDSLGSSKLSGGEGNLSFIEVMNRNGVRARATTFKDKSDESFMHRIKSVLEIPQNLPPGMEAKPRLLIMKGNPGIIADIEGVQWKKDKHMPDTFLPKLEISDKDWLACLKYALATSIMYNNGKKPKIKRPKNKNPWGRLKKG